MHCQEPWYVGVQNDQTYIVAGEPPAQGNDHPNHQADRTVIAKVYLNDRSAQRIVTCVNACHGIPSEQLELGGATFIRLLNERAQLKRQRDALRAALEKAEDAIRELAEECDGDYDLADELRAAIDSANSYCA